MVGVGVFIKFDGGLGLLEPDKFCRDDGSLMQKLVKRVLTVGSRFAENQGSELMAEEVTVNCDGFSIGLHVELLDVGNEFL